MSSHYTTEEGWDFFSQNRELVPPLVPIIVDLVYWNYILLTFWLINLFLILTFFCFKYCFNEQISYPDIKLPVGILFSFYSFSENVTWTDCDLPQNLIYNHSSASYYTGLCLNVTSWDTSSWTPLSSVSAHALSGPPLAFIFFRALTVVFVPLSRMQNLWGQELLEPKTDYNTLNICRIDELEKAEWIHE